MFNILVSEGRLKYMNMRNKVNLKKEFDTGDTVLVSKQLNRIRKDGVYPKLVLKKSTQQILGEGYTELILDSVFAFL